MLQRAISLGNEIVKELKLEPGGNTLSRWMAHYIAEKIAASENMEGAEKSDAELKCFETILSLWQHLSAFPDGRRPFESFEPIFRALGCLDPESTDPFYFQPPQYRHPNLKNNPFQKKMILRSLRDVAFWLSVI